jgi:hypothetical protein
LQIALAGHSEMQTPQSMHVSGSTTICVSEAWKALTGQTEAQVPHLMQESFTTEGILLSPLKKLKNNFAVI